MTDMLKNLFGGGSNTPPVAKPDADFADFAGAAEPVPVTAPDATGAMPAAGVPGTAVPWTKWYNIHERHSLTEFQTEGYILLVGLVIVIFHIIGSRANRSRAKAWIRAHAPILHSEFALVGFGGIANSDGTSKPDTLIKEKSLSEFATYATGRQNTAFMDVKITLTKKFNPMVNIMETLAGFFFENSIDMPLDTVEAFIYPFDGREDKTVPAVPGSAELRAKDGKSTYDSFVWAIVNKNVMQKARSQRYDLSLTTTKDHPKLPNWLTVMSESAEITDALLTTELSEAIQAAGENFDYLIISDQPTEKPTTVAEANPTKRIVLKYRMPSGDDYSSLTGIFSYFARIPDVLVQSAHFRANVLNKVRATRDFMIKEIKKTAEEEKAEERLAEKEKARKAKRDAELSGLDAKAQKKYLDRERERELRKSQKRQTMRG